MKTFQKSVTLMEIMMVVVLIGILATLGIVSFQKTMENARKKEAQSLLLLMKHAEDVVRTETNTYVACDNSTACNDILRLNLPTPATPVWSYSVPNAGNDTFCAQATSSIGLDPYSIRQDQDNATNSGC
jgi:Tfp pilus assembly protein PilE